MRVRLILQLSPRLPLGSLGTAVDPYGREMSYLPECGMVRVKWDCGFEIPMYMGELEVVTDYPVGAPPTPAGAF